MLLLQGHSYITNYNFYLISESYLNNSIGWDKKRTGTGSGIFRVKMDGTCDIPAYIAAQYIKICTLLSIQHKNHYYEVNSSDISS